MKKKTLLVCSISFIPFFVLLMFITPNVVAALSFSFMISMLTGAAFGDPADGAVE